MGFGSKASSAIPFILQSRGNAHFNHLVLLHETEAVRRAGCRSEECFFADDIPEFVEGARGVAW